MFENIDWGFVFTVGGFIVGVIGLIIGTRNITKKVIKNIVKKSHNIKISKDADVTINQTNSHNTNQSIDDKKDGE